MEIRVNPAKIRNFLLICIAILTVAHIVNRLTVPFLGHGFPLFELDAEHNIPTFYSAVTLLLSAIILFLIAFCVGANAKFFRHWLILSLVFLFLAIDENCEIHERVTFWLKPYIHTHGLLYSVWILPYALFLLLFVVSYIRFLLHLPRRFAILFVVSGAIYVAGAIGFEALGERLSELSKENTFAFVAMVTIEEFLEMLGIALFIYSLLDYISATFPDLRLKIDKETFRA